MRKSTWKKIKQARLAAFAESAKKSLLEQAETVPGGIRATAYHESAHAVVAELFDFRIREVSIVPSFINERDLKLSMRTGGPVGARVGHCRHITDRVPLSSPLRGICFRIGHLASIPAEKRLGTPMTQEAFLTDVEKAVGDLPAGPFKEHMGRVMSIVATALVSRDDVWAAITELAETVLERKTLDGDAIREIVHRHIAPEHFVTEAEQTAANAELMSEGGIALFRWLRQRLAVDLTGI